MGNVSDEIPGPVRLPPTPPVKRRRKRPPWVLPLAGGVALLTGAVGVSSLLNNEVSRRLATVPPPTSAPTTIVTVPPTAPPTSAEVLGVRVGRPAAVRTTTSTTAAAPPVTEPLLEAATPSEIIAALEKLRVEEEHSEGYMRRMYGFYRDADGNGCTTPNEVAISEGKDVKVNRNCTLQSGTWFSPYDAQTLTLPRDIDVDHLVSLREAWESGAWEWSAPKRNKYLNDLEHPEVMLVVSEMSRAERADEDPGNWLPSNEAFRCDYLKAWVNIKTLYDLSVDPGEREAIAGAALYC